VKFARQLAAVLFVVAAVTALGVAWGHSSAAGWITPHGGSIASRIRLLGPAAKGHAVKGHGVIALPPGAHPPRGALRDRVIREHADAAQLHLSNIGNLISTAEIVVAAMAGAIAAEIGWRRAWRARRRAARGPAAAAAAAAAGPPPTAGPPTAADPAGAAE
jgi:hypothetical protein